MTREQARSKLMEMTANECTPRWMEDFIDSAVALGMLTLDKPDNCDRMKEVLVSILEEYDSLKHLRGPSAFVYMLDKSGYKIVKK